MRERLIELIRASGCVETWDHYTDDFKKPNPIYELADHLIANGVILPPCKAGQTVYAQLHNYGKGIHKCEVVKVKACQFKGGKWRYFLDVEFYIADPFYCDGRLMRCGHQVVFGEDYGSWNRAFLTREEAETALKGGAE